MDKYAVYVMVVYLVTFGVLAAYLAYLFRRLHQEAAQEREQQ